MRLHRPTGIWLLLWPCWWSIALASQGSTLPVDTLLLFALGAIIMRSAGCVINDMVDRDIDAQVARTRMRPLASGALSMNEALWLLVILLSLGLVILLQLNILTIAMGATFLIPVVLYPFMKRWIPWPQAFLGLTINAGAVLGWTAVQDGIHYPALLLYVACWCWTMGYDTIYAHQDKKDDIHAGVKSTALSMGQYTKTYVLAFYLIMLVCLAFIGNWVFISHNIIYYSTLAVAFIQLLWQVRSVDLDNPQDCMVKFKSNTWLGWIVFLGIITEKLLTYI